MTTGSLAAAFLGLALVLSSVILLINRRQIRRLERERVGYVSQVERYRTLVQNSQDVILLMDRAGRTEYGSPSLTRVLGYDVEEVKGRQPFWFIHPEDAAASLRNFLELLGRPGASQVQEFRVRRLDGSWRWVESTTTNLLESPAVNAVLCNLRDITDQQAARAQIRELNEALERKVEDRTLELKQALAELESFSYSVSHDLRSPLRHIGGFVELLHQRSAAGLDDQGKRYLEIISESVKRMDALISHLLEFSRTGRQAVKPEALDMEGLVRQCIAELEPETGGRKVEWRIAALPPALADAALVRQVVSNLLSNALKFTRGVDPARIEAGYSEGGYYVRDNGTGFDMQYAHKLFGVFQRLHSSSEFEGSGIGLANVQRIVHRHGGRVWAEGKPGEGACFHFTLPDGKDASGWKS